MYGNPLSKVQRDIIDRLQVDLPLVPRPFQDVASAIHITEAELIEHLHDLRESHLVVRVGPRFDPIVMGGGDTMLALSVPEDLMERVCAVIDYLPEIAHAYRREHAFNVWCTVMTERDEDVAGAIERLRHETGLSALKIPKITGFHRNGKQPTIMGPQWQPDSLDRKLILATQGGLPLVPHPFEEVGRWLGISGNEVIERLEHMHHVGVIRCIVAVLNRPNLGLGANALCAWEVQSTHVQEVGTRFAQHAFISQCSERPAQSAEWPYTLYTMVYGATRESVHRHVAILEETIAQVSGHVSPQKTVMFASRVLKKRGLRLTMRVH